MLDYAAKMARNHHQASQADIQRLREVGFTDADILHMIYWIASFNMANTISDCVGLEPHEHITAVFVDDVPREYDLSDVETNTLRQQETVRPGWERAVVRALEGRPLEWINTQPMTWSDVQGKVLLVAYWDATHSNSLVGISHLQRWHGTYAPDGFAVLAPHTAELPIAQDPAIVRYVVERAKISYPVILDPSFRQMAGANNRYWPAIHLIDRDGFVRFRHYGPGGYETIEAHVQALLNENKGDDDAKSPTLADHHPENRWLHPAATPEFYPAYRFGRKSAGIAGRMKAVNTFSIPQEQSPNQFYVGGEWIVQEEGLELAAGTGRCMFQYCAERAGFFASLAGEAPVTFQIWLDGEPIPENSAGADANAQSQVVVDRPRFYWIAKHRGLESHQIELEVSDSGARMHRFSFLPFCGVME